MTEETTGTPGAARYVSDGLFEPYHRGPKIQTINEHAIEFERLVHRSSRLTVRVQPHPAFQRWLISQVRKRTRAVPNDMAAWALRGGGDFLQQVSRTPMIRGGSDRGFRRTGDR